MPVTEGGGTQGRQGVVAAVQQLSGSLFRKCMGSAMGSQRTREGKKGEIGSKKAKPGRDLALGLEVRLVALVDVGVGHGKGTATALFICDCINKRCGVVAVIGPG